MRIAPPPPILLGMLAHLWLLLISSSVAASYQMSRSCNYQPPRQSRYQGMDSCKVGGMGQSNGKQPAYNIAQQAAQDAKKASDNQMPAAVAAARQVKIQLAEKAAAAAWAAEAALAGKLQFVEHLQAEVREAQTVLQSEICSVDTTQASANAACITANQAHVLLQQLRESIKIAEEEVSSAEAAASGAQQEVNEKNKLVDAGRNRVEMLIQQLRTAQCDYVNTKKAAYRAACAASEARQKALKD